MRALKFAGVFLGTLILVFFIVFGFNLKALFTLFENHKGIKEGQEWVSKTSSLKGLTEYIGAQPEHVSFSSIVLNHPDSSLIYNEHTPRTMGLLSNLFTVIEYAREVEQGRLQPDEQVPLQKINQYQLPYMHHSNHEDALNWLSKQPGSNEKSVALEDVVQASVEYNDMAIADFLLFKIDPKNIDHLMDKLSLQETEAPLPLSGLYITLNPHLENRAIETHIDSLSQLSRDEFSRLVMQKARQFIKQKAYHQKVVNQFQSDEGLGIKFTTQRDLLAFFPKTTAAEMAGLMKKLQQNKLISASVSAKVKQFLSWPMRNSQLKRQFVSYGAIYDNRMGMANGINFGISSSTGEAFAQAVFFDDLQVALWFHMSSNLMHEDFERRLMWDVDLRGATRKAIRHAQPVNNVKSP